MLSVLRSTSVEEAEYGAVVLPFTVLRRLECVMEPRREVMSEVVTPHETEQQRRTQLTIRTRSADNVGLSFWATSDYNQVRTHRRRGGRDVREVRTRLRSEHYLPDATLGILKCLGSLVSDECSERALRSAGLVAVRAAVDVVPCFAELCL